MRNRCHIVFLIALSFGCDENEGPTKLSLSGRWFIESVVYDGVAQSGWKDIEFRFEQQTDSAGVYFLSHTPDDTIWRTTGDWRITKARNGVTFDNSLKAEYDVSSNRFIFITYLPWTVTSTCQGDVCLPIATGQWVFNLMR